MVRRKNKKRNMKIIIAVVIAAIIVAGVLSVLFVTGNVNAPEGTSQGLFGLFSTGGDYGTGITVDTNTKYSANVGVTGTGETMPSVFYRIIDASIGSEAKIAAQGTIKVNANRGPEEWWKDPYIIDKITGYWYVVYYKDSGSAGWSKIIDRTFTDGSRVIRTGEMAGNGFQTGWTIGLGTPPFFYNCNPLSFWVKTSDAGTGAIKVEVHCSVSWKVDTEKVDDILCSTDEAYIAPQTPTEAPPTTPAANTLTITTTPGAYVYIFGVGGKMADASGVTIFTSMQSGTYTITISYQKGGYYDKELTLNYPETTELSASLTPTGGGAAGPSPNDLTIQAFHKDCTVVLSKGTFTETKITNDYGVVTWTSLGAGKYTVTVSKTGYRTQTITVTMPGAGTVQVYLQQIGQAPPQEPTSPPQHPGYNQKPQVRTLDGPSVGNVGVAYEFSVTAYDPEGDTLLYKFYWGDGTYTGWLSEQKAMHAYLTDGTYNVFVQAYDGVAYGDSSNHPIAIGAGGNLDQLTVPLISGNNFITGEYTLVIVKVQTTVDEADFDIMASVQGPSGAFILEDQVVLKTKSGDLFSATLSFKCDEVGIVTISAQSIAKTTEHSNSMVRMKQLYCSQNGEAPKESLKESVSAEGTAPVSPRIPGFELPILFVAAAAFILIKRRNKYK